MEVTVSDSATQAQENPWPRMEKAFMRGAGIAIVAGCIAALNESWNLCIVCANTVVIWRIAAFVCWKAARISGTD